MLQFIEQLKQGDFSDFKGATLQASIPLRQELINEMAQEALPKSSGSLTIHQIYCTIEAQNQVEVSLAVEIGPITKTVKLSFYIEQGIDFPESPIVHIVLKPSLLLSFGGFLSSLFGLLPPGITVSNRPGGKLIAIDLNALIKDEKARTLLHYIKSGEIQSQTGKLIFNVRLEVD